MIIKKIVSNLLSSNMYTIESQGHTILIDPFISELSKQCNIDYILLSHEHYDHISGVNYWKGKTGAKVICSKVCSDNIKNSKKNLSRYFKAFCELQTWITDISMQEECIIKEDIDYACEADITFEKEICFQWQGHNIKMFETPGHSLGSSCIIIDEKYLFSGDSLFRDVPTECGLPGGNKKKWFDFTQPLLMSLDKFLHVYPGHLEEFDLKDYNLWKVR